jgi:hypothetical protein
MSRNTMGKKKLLQKLSTYSNGLLLKLFTIKHGTLRKDKTHRLDKADR